MSESIFLVKNGLAFPVERLGFIQRPFSFKIAETRLGYPNEFLIRDGEQPIYFKRMRMRMKGGQVQERFIHRICVGVRRPDGSMEKHWINPDGSYDCPNLEPDLKTP